LKFLKQKEDFSNFTAVLDEYVSQTSTVLAELLRYCVASTVTAGTQHGFTLMIQLLVEREGVNSCDIVIASMIQIFKLYKAEVNKDKVALPLIKAYSQTVINPKLFLQVWQRLQLKLLVDVHTSAKTKEAAMLDLQTIFPVRFDVKQALKNLKASTATFPIGTFGLILRVTYSNTTLPNVSKEMTRLYPVVR